MAAVRRVPVHDSPVRSALDGYHSLSRYIPPEWDTTAVRIAVLTQQPRKAMRRHTAAARLASLLLPSSARLRTNYILIFIWRCGRAWVLPRPKVILAANF